MKEKSRKLPKKGASSSSASDSNAPQESPLPKARQSSVLRKHRAWILCGLLVLLTGMGWYSGLAARIPQQLARDSIARNQLNLADYWLSWAEQLSYQNSENSLLMARVARYRGDAAELKAKLSESRLRGADIERVELERALALAQIGVLDDAEPLIGDWLQRADAESDEICNAYANGLAAGGRFDDAMGVLIAWRSTYPDDPRCDYRIGRLQEHQDEYDAAEQSYRRSIAIDSNFLPAHFSLGRALLHQRRAEEALTEFQYCLQLEQPEAAMIESALALKALGRTAEARSLFLDVLTNPRETIEGSYRALDEQPAGFRAAAEYGRLETDAGNFEAALPWLQKALEEDPLDLTVRYALGVALRGLGDQAAAKREFDAVEAARKRMMPATALNQRIKSDPTDLDARLELGKLVLENESERIGLYWIRSILTYDPDHSEAHAVLANYYLKKSTEDPNFKALARFHQTKAMNNSSSH